MLVLTREKGQWLVVGEGQNAVRIQVASIRGDKVRLACEGPRHIRVDREEVALQRGLKMEATDANPT